MRPNVSNSLTHLATLHQFKSFASMTLCLFCRSSFPVCHSLDKHNVRAPQCTVNVHTPRRHTSFISLKGQRLIFIALVFLFAAWMTGPWGSWSLPSFLPWQHFSVVQPLNVGVGSEEWKQAVFDFSLWLTMERSFTLLFFWIVWCVFCVSKHWNGIFQWK